MPTLTITGLDRQAAAKAREIAVKHPCEAILCGGANSNGTHRVRLATTARDAQTLQALQKLAAAWQAANLGGTLTLNT